MARGLAKGQLGGSTRAAQSCFEEKKWGETRSVSPRNDILFSLLPLSSGLLESKQKLRTTNTITGQKLWGEIVQLPTYLPPPPLHPQTKPLKPKTLCMSKAPFEG